MKAEKLREKDRDQLLADVAALRLELKNLRFQKVKGELKNTHKIKATKKDIARILTVWGEKK
ncbi:50S ribosomal protein L29 [Candidatus Saganbacteria bacterium]|nr:50S ribosomal protein L29 [Candidatus Saganbacteria bacterium]